MPKTLPHCSHTPRRLTRKRGIYYYRRRLPGQPDREVALSLHTKDFREAEHLASLLDDAFNRFGAAVTDAINLRQILRDYLEAGLDADWETRLNAPYGRPVYIKQETDDPVAADLELIDELLHEAHEQLATRNTRSVVQHVDSLMLAYEVPEQFRKALSMGLLATNVDILKHVRERVIGRAGEYSAPHRPEAPAAALPPQPAPGVPFSDFAETYSDFGIREMGWKGQTLAQNRATFAMFTELTGDKGINEYTRKDTGDFYEALRKLPALYSKDSRWRGKPLKTVIEEAAGVDCPRLSMKTMQRHFSALGGLFTSAKRLGRYDGENPAHGFAFPKKGRANTGRKMWEGDALRKLFTSPIWTGSHPRFRARPGAQIFKDEQYWLPLLGLYHGNRLEEFAQLRREDIKQEDGIWFFNITDEDGRQLKNEQSKRRVPIHAELLRLGFLEFVKPDSPKQKLQIFENLKPGGPDKKLGFYYSKNFTAYRRAIGVYEDKLDYHSFRHGVTTKLIAAGTSSAIVDELTGHEGKGTSASVYYKGAPLKELQAAINRIEWPEVSL